MKAVNVTNTNVREVTLAIDMTVAEYQVSRITDVLQNKELGLTPTERTALMGARAVLAAAADVKVATPRKKYTRMTATTVDQLRDLYMCGHNADYLANKYGLRAESVVRMLKGYTFSDRPYHASEFAPPNVDDLLPEYPWGKAND